MASRNGAGNGRGNGTTVLVTVDGEPRRYSLRGNLVNTVRRVARARGISQYSVRVMKNGDRQTREVDESELREMSPRSVRAVEISTYDQAGRTA